MNKLTLIALMIVLTCTASYAQERLRAEPSAPALIGASFSIRSSALGFVGLLQQPIGTSTRVAFGVIAGVGVGGSEELSRETRQSSSFTVTTSSVAEGFNHFSLPFLINASGFTIGPSFGMASRKEIHTVTSSGYVPSEGRTVTNKDVQEVSVMKTDHGAMIGYVHRHLGALVHWTSERRWGASLLLGLGD